MNKSYFLVFPILILLFSSCKEDVDISEITYWKQEDLAKYEEELLSINVLNTDMFLDFDVTDISSLRNIEEIKGELRIQGRELESLQFLEKLRRVGGLEIVGTNRLKEIILPDLEISEGYITIRNNNILDKVELKKVVAVNDFGVGVFDNPELRSCSMPNLEIYNGLSILRNPNFSVLEMNQPIPENASHDVRIEFDKMKSPEELFQNSELYAGLKIGINNVNESDLTWMKNINPDKFKSIKIYGDFTVSEFCELAPMMNTLQQPGSFLFMDELLFGKLFSGTNIIDECL